MSTNPLVSVLITTFNSANTLDACLDSVLEQTYTNTEIILIDNYSTDSTLQIAKRFNATIIIKKCGRSEAINLGAKIARGEYLYRLDSDCIAEPKLIEEAVEHCRRGFNGVVVPVTTHPDMGGWARIRKLERDMYLQDPTHVAARFMEKNAFDSIGGFNETLTTGEDFDVQLRFLVAGFKLADIEAKEYDIGGPTTLSGFCIKNYEIGKSAGRFIKTNKRAIIIIQPFRLAYWHHRHLFLSHPKNFFGILVLNSVRYLSAVIGWFASKFD